jgi:cell wall-associated NlpC family hydrolase
MPRFIPCPGRHTSTHRAVYDRALRVMLGLTVMAPSLAAQSAIRSPFSIETFAARNESRNAALFGGLSLAGYSGSWGLRLNTSLSGLNSTGDNQFGGGSGRDCNRFGCRPGYSNGYNDGSSLNVNSWSVDADLIAEPFRQVPVLRQVLLGFSPYAFLGIGHYAVNAASTLERDTSQSIWSYGVGVQHDLIARVGLTAEARARRSLNNNAFVGGTFREAIQYRIGLNVGLGGGPKKKQPTPRVVWRGPIPGSTPVTTSSVPAMPAPVSVSPSADEQSADALVPSLIDQVESLLNTRWRSGGTTPDDGFDAGGFVQYVFAQEDIPLPRLVRDLAQTGVFVQPHPTAMRAGDLLFFSSDGALPPDHVAIFVGHDRFVHASASGGGVLYDTFTDGARGNWFALHLVAVRRVLGSRNSDSRVPPSSLTPSGRPDTAPRPSGGR